MSDPTSELHKLAESAAKDISADFPGVDTSYDLWVEECGGRVLGVIDMGELYREVFVWHEPLPGWVLEPRLDPYEATEEIIRHRKAEGW